MESKSISTAKKAVSSVKQAIKKSRSKKALLKKLIKSKEKYVLKKEPIAHNIVSYILHHLNDKEEYEKEKLFSKADNLQSHLKTLNERIADFGHGKIKRGMDVFVHGYSSAIVSILLKAKNLGINFEVHNVEARPTLSGKQMASELAKHGISIKHYADLGLRQALKKADIVFLGAKIISEKGQIYATIGSELIAELAEKHDVPVYVCANSLKFNPNIAKQYESEKKLRSSKEIWSKPPRRTRVFNYEFEKINPQLITGIITEIGIFKPNYLISEIKRQCPWI